MQHYLYIDNERYNHDGALRDALSTLDLIKTFSKNSKNTIKDVTKNLNIIDNDY